MPDANLAIQNHHAEMVLWWKKPIYKKARIEFCKRNPVCSRCGRKSQTPGHSHDQYQHGFDYYLACVIADRCDPLCNACNRAESKGKKPCPICVKENPGGNPWYISQHQEHCYLHRPAEEIRQSQARKEVFKMLVKQSQKITNARKRAIYQELKRK